MRFASSAYNQAGVGFTVFHVCYNYHSFIASLQQLTIALVTPELNYLVCIYPAANVSANLQVGDDNVKTLEQLLYIPLIVAQDIKILDAIVGSTLVVRFSLGHSSHSFSQFLLSTMITLSRREISDQSTPDSGLAPLLIAVLVLVSVGVLLGGVFLFALCHRKGIKDLESQISKNARKTRQLVITTIPFIHGRFSLLNLEKKGLVDSCSPALLAADPVPEIRITFPEEEDPQGRRKPGGVVIVQVGEAGVGYVRPLPEGLPPYQERDGFSSIDLDKIGGLKEPRSVV